MTWTADRIAVVRLHWGDKTARQIGDMIGKSKNAVLGKVQRLGLSGEPNMSGKALNARQRKRPVRGPRKTNSTNGCQWLEGEPRNRDFCGDPCREGTSYCPAHYLRCHQPPGAYRAEAA